MKVSPSCNDVLAGPGTSVRVDILETLERTIEDGVILASLEDFLARSSISNSERVTMGVLDLVFSSVQLTTSGSKGRNS